MEEHCMIPGSNLPVPDPTHMTTRQLLREISNLKDMILTRLVSSDAERSLIQSILETRLDGMDKATVLLRSAVDKLPDITDEKISALREVQNEKFNSTRNQLIEMDVQTERSSKNNNIAVGNAFSAAKEAVAEQNKSSALAISKSEAATGKQIEQLQQLTVKGNESLDEKINDIKDRLTRVEGNSEGKTVADTSHQTSASFIVAVVAALIAFSSVAVAIVAVMWKR